MKFKFTNIMSSVMTIPFVVIGSIFIIAHILLVKCKWYRKLHGGVWFLNTYHDSKGRRFSKWSQDRPSVGNIEGYAVEKMEIH